MITLFNELITSGSLFWFCALAGSGMLLIQFIISIFGISNHESFDSSDVNHEHGQDARRFKWLSMQTLTGFLMMFGWTAITCKNEFDLTDTTTFSISLFSGLISAFLIHSIFKLANKLKSSGNIYKIEDAIGKEAYVYQCIPKGGKGKISFSLQNLTFEIDAISHHSEDLPSFIRVKIIEKSDDTTVIVAPL